MPTGDGRFVQDGATGFCWDRRMKIEFLASVAVIAPDPPASRKLYVDAIGLPLAGRGSDEYHHTDKLGACKHFGVWPLSQAAEACFGTREWPGDRPVPQASIEFDLEDAAAVDAAVKELQDTGHELLHAAAGHQTNLTVGHIRKAAAQVAHRAIAMALVEDIHEIAEHPRARVVQLDWPDVHPHAHQAQADVLQAIEQIIPRLGHGRAL